MLKVSATMLNDKDYDYLVRKKTEEVWFIWKGSSGLSHKFKY